MSPQRWGLSRMDLVLRYSGREMDWKSYGMRLLNFSNEMSGRDHRTASTNTGHIRLLHRLKHYTHLNRMSMRHLYINNALLPQ